MKRKRGGVRLYVRASWQDSPRIYAMEERAQVTLVWMVAARKQPIVFAWTKADTWQEAFITQLMSFIHNYY